jgi:hypothetical protein
MSDDRIHLLLQWDEKYENYDNYLIFPNGQKVYLIDIQGVDELVRSLAGSISYHYQCPYCDYIISIDKIEKGYDWCDGKNHQCCCESESQLFNWNVQPKIPEKNEKLKVTFGSETWMNSCSHVFSEGCNHQDCEICNMNGEIKDIIKPLQPIEKACHELGIEVCYQ